MATPAPGFARKGAIPIVLQGSPGGFMRFTNFGNPPGISQEISPSLKLGLASLGGPGIEIVTGGQFSVGHADSPTRLDLLQLAFASFAPIPYMCQSYARVHPWTS